MLQLRTKSRIGHSITQVYHKKPVRKLQDLLGFRHVFVYIYGAKLDYEQMLKNAERVNKVFPSVSKELNVFIAYLGERRK